MSGPAGGEPAVPAAVVVRGILGWWAGARQERDRLPWRRTRDPWEVLVAETMLAQTQVGRVGSRYEELLDRFPTPAALACSPVGDVVRAWSGLGYNRRAVLLHSAACALVERHQGVVPRELHELLALPGVGPYTARAVQAIAFGARVGVVDTNVGRVLARAVAGRALRAQEAQRLADRLVPDGSARDWAVALMDFGALVCRARRPGCAGCPLGTACACAWRCAGAGGADPAIGSSAVTRPQGRFAGSDREGRGRLVRAACAGPVGGDELARAAGWPEDPGRALAVARALVADAVLVETPDGSFALP